MKRWWLPILTSLVLSVPAIAGAEVKVISLAHRAAADLVPQVEEILDREEKVQAVGSNLVLVADGESLQAAQELIRLLDQPLQSLDVRVRQEEQRISSGLATPGARHLGNSSRQSEQRLRILEGEGGWIEVGRDVPYTRQWAALTGDSTGYAETIDYQTIAIGFWVEVSQLRDERVLVEILPEFRRQQGPPGSPPEIRFSRLSSRLEVPLGQWVALGSQLQGSGQVGQQILGWHASSGETRQEIFLRIDKVAGFSP